MTAWGTDGSRRVAAEAPGSCPYLNCRYALSSRLSSAPHNPSGSGTSERSRRGGATHPVWHVRKRNLLRQVYGADPQPQPVALADTAWAGGRTVLECRDCVRVMGGIDRPEIAVMRVIGGGAPAGQSIHKAFRRPVL